MAPGRRSPPARLARRSPARTRLWRGRRARARPSRAESASQRTRPSHDASSPGARDGLGDLKRVVCARRRAIAFGGPRPSPLYRARGPARVVGPSATDAEAAASATSGRGAAENAFCLTRSSGEASDHDLRRRRSAAARVRAPSVTAAVTPVAVVSSVVGLAFHSSTRRPRARAAP